MLPISTFLLEIAANNDLTHKCDQDYILDYACYKPFVIIQGVYYGNYSWYAE